VDSPIRLRWEVTKQEFDNCEEFQNRLTSPKYTVRIGQNDVDWSVGLYQEDKDNVVIYLKLESDEETYTARSWFGVETSQGLWSNPIKKNFDFDGDASWGQDMGTPQEFAKHFVDGKLVVVAILEILMEGDNYSDHMKIADHYVDEMRSISNLDNLSDFTVISGSVHFPCHRVLLAARSKYFEAMFRNEPEKKSLQMEEPPEVVKDFLDYIARGCIPADMDAKAVDMILMADMYGLDLLTIACQTSMVNNLTAENAVETLIIMDKVKHVSKEEHRQKILAFIKKEAAQIARSKDWEMFVRNYPNLVTEIILSLASS